MSPRALCPEEFSKDYPLREGMRRINSPVRTILVVMPQRPLVSRNYVVGFDGRRTIYYGALIHLGLGNNAGHCACVAHGLLQYTSPCFCLQLVNTGRAQCRCQPSPNVPKSSITAVITSSPLHSTISSWRSPHLSGWSIPGSSHSPQPWLCSRDMATRRSPRAWSPSSRSPS